MLIWRVTTVILIQQTKLWKNLKRNFRKRKPNCPKYNFCKYCKFKTILLPKYFLNSSGIYGIESSHWTDMLHIICTIRTVRYDLDKVRVWIRVKFIIQKIFKHVHILKILFWMTRKFFLVEISPIISVIFYDNLVMMFVVIILFVFWRILEVRAHFCWNPIVCW